MTDGASEPQRRLSCVIVGGSVAGLLAAQVACSHFDGVVVLDSDSMAPGNGEGGTEAMAEVCCLSATRRRSTNPAAVRSHCLHRQTKTSLCLPACLLPGCRMHQSLASQPLSAGSTSCRHSGTVVTGTVVTVVTGDWLTLRVVSPPALAPLACRWQRSTRASPSMGASSSLAVVRLAIFVGWKAASPPLAFEQAEHPGAD